MNKVSANRFRRKFERLPGVHSTEIVYWSQEDEHHLTVYLVGGRTVEIADVDTAQECWEDWREGGIWPWQTDQQDH